MRALAPVGALVPVRRVLLHAGPTMRGDRGENRMFGGVGGCVGVALLGRFGNTVGINNECTCVLSMHYVLGWS